jgi:3-hydroxymyristoyl/3-hydroxydecanoyl-(acyl carrier protein) dehydratase
LLRVELPIDPQHPAFAGHFPGEPIVPGVVLLDETLYALFGTAAAGAQIVTVKFHHPVRPGERAVLEYEAAADSVRFTIRVGAIAVASGTARYPGATPP